MKNKIENQRAKEFLSCLGNGKSIYQCEAENDLIDDFWDDEEEKILIEEQREFQKIIESLGEENE